MLNKRHIIFDLDGTLIDSSESILDSIARAFDENNQALRHPLTNKIIGPSLQETLSYLSGTEDLSLLKKLSDSFKKNYDEKGFLQTKEYPGISSMLTSLMGHNFYMYVATNKRIVPTLKILNHLGWDKYFKEVCSIDSTRSFGNDKSKAGILLHIIKNNNISNNSVYIGDRKDDLLASKKVGIPFFYATWGYGDRISDQINNLKSPQDLSKHFIKDS